MEQFTGEDALAAEQSARDQLRAQAREQSSPGPYVTPTWLDGTFVLPDQETPPVRAAHSEAVAVPRPRAEVRPEVPVFQRPATPEVDFAAVMRRADLARRARVVTVAALVLAVLAAVVFQLSGQPAVAVVAVLAALVSLGGVVTRVALHRAEVPYRSS